MVKLFRDAKSLLRHFAKPLQLAHEKNTALLCGLAAFQVASHASNFLATFTLLVKRLSKSVCTKKVTWGLCISKQMKLLAKQWLLQIDHSRMVRTPKKRAVVPVAWTHKLDIRYSIRSKEFDTARWNKRYNRAPGTIVARRKAKADARAKSRAKLRAAKSKKKSQKVKKEEKRSSKKQKTEKVTEKKDVKKADKTEKKKVEVKEKQKPAPKVEASGAGKSAEKSQKAPKAKK